MFSEGSIILIRKKLVVTDLLNQTCYRSRIWVSVHFYLNLTSSLFSATSYSRAWLFFLICREISSPPPLVNTVKSNSLHSLWAYLFICRSDLWCWLILLTSTLWAWAGSKVLQTESALSCKTSFTVYLFSNIKFQTYCFSIFKEYSKQKYASANVCDI